MRIVVDLLGDDDPLVLQHHVAVSGRQRARATGALRSADGSSIHEPYNRGPDRRRRAHGDARQPVGVLGNVTGALLAVPVVVLMLAGALFGQSDPWVERIPEAGLVVFGG